MREKITNLRCCVIIPTYNNDKTLATVIRDVLNWTEAVIVINDGSTDKTPEILGSFPQITTIHNIKNSGKGLSLRKGFKLAIEKGFRYAITIDSDGQHFASDIPAFIDCIELYPDSMIVGARNMKQAGVPGTSHFGHRFSIFWFKVETGLAIDDVQTGYRLYPLNEIKKIKHCYSQKFEFEVEILVRLAWRNVPIASVPVRIYYAPKEERVSHFRKFRDFARVSILNTILVFMAALWLRPLAFLKRLRKKSFRQVINEYIVNSEDSNSRISLSLGLGILMGILPIWGWQMVASFGLAHLFRLNKFVAVAASNISLPPMLPLILYLSYKTGGWALGINNASLKYSAGFGFQWIKENLVQYLLGSFLFGLGMATLLGSLTFIILLIFRKPKTR